jgi:hypothetical protein
VRPATRFTGHVESEVRAPAATRPTRLIWRQEVLLVFVVDIAPKRLFCARRRLMSTTDSLCLIR